MAKKKEPETTVEAATGIGKSEGGSVQGYFRPIFLKNPKLLKERSNEFLYQKWLQDHPGESVVPENVKQGLSNLKTVLRKKLAVKRGRHPKGEHPAQEPAKETAVQPKASRLQTPVLGQLEELIDDALSLAKQFDPESLHDVIRHLRSARNRVVIQLGVD